MFNVLDLYFGFCDSLPNSSEGIKTIDFFCFSNNKVDMSFDTSKIESFYNDYANPINDTINNDVLFAFQCNGNSYQQFMCVALKLFLVVYAASLAPKLPNYALLWFNHIYVRILVLFLIAWTSSHDPALSIMIAISFYVTINILNGKSAFEKFAKQGVPQLDN